MEYDRKWKLFIMRVPEPNQISAEGKECLPPLVCLEGPSLSSLDPQKNATGSNLLETKSFLGTSCAGMYLQSPRRD